MRKSAIIIIISLLMIAPVYAVDLTGQFAVTGGVGYGFGFGAAFDEFEYPGGGTEEHKLTFAAGGGGRYNFTPEMGVRMFVIYQAYDWDWESGGVPALTESGSENWIQINANFTYTMMPEGNTMPYFMAGPGYYMPSHEDADSEIGFNGGVGVLHFFSPELALDASANFHWINTEGDAPTFIQFLAGVSYFFGGGQ